MLYHSGLTFLDYIGVLVGVILGIALLVKVYVSTQTRIEWKTEISFERHYRSVLLLIVGADILMAFLFFWIGLCGSGVFLGRVVGVAFGYFVFVLGLNSLPMPSKSGEISTDPKSAVSCMGCGAVIIGFVLLQAIPVLDILEILFEILSEA